MSKIITILIPVFLVVFISGCSDGKSKNNQAQDGVDKSPTEITQDLTITAFNIANSEFNLAHKQAFDISLSATEAIAATEFTLSLTEKSKGSGEEAESFILYQKDISFSEEKLSMDISDAFTVNKSLKAGQYTLIASIDSYNAIAESDESNNGLLENSFQKKFDVTLSGTHANSASYKVYGEFVDGFLPVLNDEELLALGDEDTAPEPDPAADTEAFEAPLNAEQRVTLAKQQILLNTSTSKNSEGQQSIFATLAAANGDALVEEIPEPSRQKHRKEHAVFNARLSITGPDTAGEQVPISVVVRFEDGREFPVDILNPETNIWQQEVFFSGLATDGSISEVSLQLHYPPELVKALIKDLSYGTDQPEFLVLIDADNSKNKFAAGNNVWSKDELDFSEDVERAEGEESLLEQDRQNELLEASEDLQQLIDILTENGQLEDSIVDLSIDRSQEQGISLDDANYDKGGLNGEQVEVAPERARAVITSPELTGGIAGINLSGDSNKELDINITLAEGSLSSVEFSAIAPSEHGLTFESIVSDNSEGLYQWMFSAETSLVDYQENFLLLAVDDLGNLQSKEIIVKVLKDNEQPSFTLSQSNVSTQSFSTIAFTMSAQDDGTVQAYTQEKGVEPGAFSNLTKQKVDNLNYNFTFKAPDVFQARDITYLFWLEDNKGVRSELQEITFNVQPLPPLQLTIEASKSLVQPGKLISFTSQLLPLDRTVTSYTWKQETGETIALSNADQENLEFVMPELYQDSSDIIFSLKVTDEFNKSIIETVKINANFELETVLLNDTGAMRCGDYPFPTDNINVSPPQNERDTDCSSLADLDDDPVPQGQDALFGRDQLQAQGSLSKFGAGDAGFDFSKINSTQEMLPANAPQWDCVKDNVTGLYWEAKAETANDPAAANTDLRDKDHTYTWFNPNLSSGQGSEGDDVLTCSGTLNKCDSNSYINKINEIGLCGFNDWRLPTFNELLSIQHFGQNHTVPAMLDTDYFPHSAAGIYWTSTTGGYNGVLSVQSVFLNFGGSAVSNKTTAGHIMLVRKGDL